MRLFLVLLSTLFFNLSFGQDYKFNKLIINTHSSLMSPETEITNLYNSEDFSYHMYFFTQNDSIKSSIIDTKNNKAHYFHIDEQDSLRFLKTDSFEKEAKTYSYTFSDVKTKEDRKEIKLKITDEKNRKVRRYNLIIKETDDNYFSYFKLNGMMEGFIFMDIVTPVNFMVLGAKGYYPGGRFVRYKLKSSEEIDLLVKVPQ